MSMKLIFAMLAAVATGLRIPAFAPAHAVRVAHPLMTGVSSLAAACLEEECSVDTVQSLVAELTIEAERLSREGTKTSKEQVEALLMLGRLQALSQNPAANQGEIEKIVSGMARSFGTVKDYDFPGSALGYTGTPNKNKVGLD